MGSISRDLAFDGVNLWVVNSGDDTVMRLRGSNGAIEHTYAVEIFPVAILFDGSNIWVTNNDSNTVDKITRTPP